MNRSSLTDSDEGDSRSNSSEQSPPLEHIQSEAHRWQELALRLSCQLNETQQLSAFDRDSRRAALNLMEDAIIARKEADRVACQLHQEATDRKRVEEALRHNEEMFSLLVQDAPFGICTIDSDFRLIRINEASYKLFKGIEPLVGRDFAEVLRSVWKEPFASDFMKQLRHTLVTGESYHFPPIAKERVNSDNHECYDCQVHRIELQDGQFSIVFYAYDLTKQKELEDRVRRAGRLDAFRIALADALRPLNDPNAIQSKAMQVLGEDLQVDRVLYAQIQSDEESIHVLGNYVRDMPELVGSFPASVFGQISERLRRGENIIISDVDHDSELTHEERQAMRGLGIRATIGVPLVKQGKWISLFGVQQRAARIWTPEDIDKVIETSERTWAAVERSRAEAAAREINARYQTLVANIPGGAAFVVDQDLRYVLADGDALRVAGLTAENFIGKKVVDVVDPSVAAEIEENFRKALAGETFRTEHTVGNRTFLTCGAPLSLDEGTTGSAIAVSYDITDRKQAEMALQEVDRRKDEFLATLAHELRNPLAPIQKSLELLQLHHSDPHSIEQVLDMLMRQVNHMIRLVDDLMEVSRISRGKLELRKEWVELNKVINDAIETSRPHLDAAGHRFTIDLHTDGVCLWGDAMRLSQVFSNLLNNAAKYTESNGEICLRSRVEDDAVIVTISDNGIGIAAEQLSLVFEPFMQVDRTHVRSQGGLGIGLTLVRSLVEAHGGSVSVRSGGVGQGSEFTVRLLLPERTNVPLHTEKSDRPMPVVTGKRILVVDDSRDAASTLAILLRHLGAQVQVENDGLSALKTIDSFDPSIVLLDIGMPGIDGREVARRIRSTKDHDTITLIALSGWGQDHDRRESLAPGFNHHLVKPLELSQLQAILATLP